MDAEKRVKDSVKDLQESDSGIVTDGLVARKMAGVLAEAHAGYSVDGKHEWTLDGYHSMYIRQSEARVHCFWGMLWTLCVIQ